MLNFEKTLKLFLNNVKFFSGMKAEFERFDGYQEALILENENSALRIYPASYFESGQIEYESTLVMTINNVTAAYRIVHDADLSEIYAENSFSENGQVGTTPSDL